MSVTPHMHDIMVRGFNFSVKICEAGGNSITWILSPEKVGYPNWPQKVGKVEIFLVASNAECLQRKKVFLQGKVQSTLALY